MGSFVSCCRSNAVHAATEEGQMEDEELREERAVQARIREELKDKNLELLNEINDRDRRIAQLEDKNQELLNRLEDLEGKCSELKEKYSQLQLTVEHVEKDKAELEVKNRKLQGAISDLEVELAELRRKYESVQMQHDQLNKEFQKAQQALDDHVQKHGELDENDQLQRKLFQAEEDLAGKSKELEDLKNKLAALTYELERLKSSNAVQKHDQLQSDFKQKCAELDDLRRKLADCEQELERSKARCEDLEGEKKLLTDLDNSSPPSSPPAPTLPSQVEPLKDDLALEKEGLRRFEEELRRETDRQTDNSDDEELKKEKKEKKEKEEEKKKQEEEQEERKRKDLGAEELARGKKGVEHLKRRPPREGMYFIMSKEMVETGEVEFTGDPIDIHETFFTCFEGMDLLAMLFVMVELTRVQIEAQRHKIRIASYRWEPPSEGLPFVGPRGAESESEYQIPSNVGWFLRMIRDRKQIGWMDFLAHVGVNGTLAGAMKYMGWLYSANIVMPEWLFSLAKLAIAMTRGWIFQESAFGALDPEAVRCFFALLREIGLRMRQQAGDRAMITEFWSAVGLAARLLACRGYEASVGADVKASFEGLKEFEDLGLQGELSRDEYNSLANKALGSVPSWTAFEHVEKLVLAEESSYAELSRGMQAFLCTALHPTLPSADAFLDLFAKSIVTAYMSRELTMEEDRERAVTSVAAAIVAQKGGELRGEGLVRACWQRVLDQIQAGAGDLDCEVCAPSEVLLPGEEGAARAGEEEEEERDVPRRDEDGEEWHPVGRMEVAFLRFDVRVQERDEGRLQVYASTFGGSFEGGVLRNSRGQPALLYFCRPQSRDDILIMCMVTAETNQICNFDVRKL